MTAAAWVLVLLIQSADRTQIRFDLPKLGKEGPAAREAIQKVDGVETCSLSGTAVTIAVKSGAAVKLSDLKIALGLLSDSDGKVLKIDEGTLKLAGHVALHLELEGGQDKVAAALMQHKGVRRCEYLDGYFALELDPAAELTLDQAARVAAGAVEKKDPVAVNEVIWVSPNLANVAEINLRILRTALESYYINTAAYPTSKEGLGALMKKPDSQGKLWRGPYLQGEKVPLDPWGRAFVYRWPGKRKDGKFDLKSLGPDGKEGTGDDVE